MKKLKRVVAFVAALVISMAAALPASALTPAFTKVAMPDPYGIMPLSLDDDSTSRTLSSSGSFWFGKQGSASEVQAFTKVYDNFSSPTVLFRSSQSAEYSTFAYNIPAGCYFDFTSSVSYSTSDFQKLLVAGSVQFRLQFFQVGGSLAAYPDRAQFLINGLPVGEPVSISSNLFSFPSMEIELSSDVSTIGYRFFYDTAKTGSKTGTFSDIETTCSVYVTDDVSVTPLEIDDPYIPILTAILSWVQNIFNSVSPLHSTLLRIEEAIDALGGLPSSFEQLIQINQDIHDGLFEDPDSGSSSGTVADQFNQDMQEQIDKADEVKDALDSLNTPAPEEIMPEIKDYVSDEELQNFTGTLTVVFDNSAIVSMMMISLSLALVAYVLFGKR